VEAQRGVNRGATADRLTVPQLVSLFQDVVTELLNLLPAADAAVIAAAVVNRAVDADLARAFTEMSQRLEDLQLGQAIGDSSNALLTTRREVAAAVAVRHDLLRDHPLGALRMQSLRAARATAHPDAATPSRRQRMPDARLAAFFHPYDGVPDVGGLVGALFRVPGASPTKTVLAFALLNKALVLQPALGVSRWNWQRLLVACAAAAHLSIDGVMEDLRAFADVSRAMDGADDLYMCVRALLWAVGGSFAIDAAALGETEDRFVEAHALLPLAATEPRNAPPPGVSMNDAAEEEEVETPHAVTDQ